MRKKGKKKARFRPDRRTARQLEGNISQASSDPLVQDQEILQEDGQIGDLANIF
jgi:hypothetical protein